jgi:bisphosphoglycerate-dependent phosphoglycerate mutase
MKNTLERTLPLWENEIIRTMAKKKKVIVVSHKNTMRALFGHL